MSSAVLALALLAQTAGGPSPVPGVASPGPGPAAASVAPRSDDDKVTCRREEETGSRVNVHRTCLTNLQWRLRAADSQNSLESLQRNGNHAFGVGPG